MADSQEFFAFSIKLAPSLAALESGNVEIFELECEKNSALKIGRGGKCDVAINCLGISWIHAEIRILPIEGKHQLALRDVSSNGTGLHLPGASLERLPKGEDTPLMDGAIISLPMRLKKAEDQRFLSVHFEGHELQVRASEGVDGKAGDTEERSEEAAVRDDRAVVAQAIKSAADEESPLAEQKATVVSETKSLRARDSASGDDEPARKQRKTLPSPEPIQFKDDEPAEKDGKPVQAPPATSERNDSTLSAPPSGPPGTRAPPRGARPKASAAAAREKAFSDVPADLRDKIKTGEGIIRDAKDAEDRNQWGQAFDCYERGLAYFMEVLPKLAKDSLGGASLRKQINGYLKKASELKGKLERSEVFGCGKLARPPRA